MTPPPVQRAESDIASSVQVQIQVQEGMASLCACIRLSSRHAALSASLALGSLLLLLLGLLGPGVVQRVLNEGIFRAIVWLPDSPEPVNLRYRGVCDANDPNAIFSEVTLYLYNITNVEEMRAEGAKPQLALVGPYRYLKLICKLDVWWDAEGRAAAKDYTRYLEHPGGPLPGDADLNANITTLNLALGGVVEAVHANVDPESARWLDLLVTVLAGWRDSRVSGMFVHRTAGELLWGYEDQLLQRLQALLPPGKVPLTRVQLVANMSGPDEARSRQPSVYNTGVFNLPDVWTVLSDRNVTTVTGWPGGSACAERVRGTDGSQFRPGLKCNHDRLTVWLSSLYRSADLVCTGPKMFHDIKLLRYQPEPTWTAPNVCKQQYIPGLINISAPLAVGAGGNGSAAAGTLLYLSRPHFCTCDPSLRQGVTGLPNCTNNLDEQGIWIDVEPITGISMRASQSIMVSSEVSVSAREHLEPRMDASPIIPIFTSHEAIEATSDQAAQFRWRVYGAKRLKAHLHLWPMLLATACASACACVLVHASVTHLKLVQQAQADEVERGRLARQVIIDRSIQNASASRANSIASGGGGGGELGLLQPLLPPETDAN